MVTVYFFIINFQENSCNSFVYIHVQCYFNDLNWLYRSHYIISSKMFAFQDFSFVKQVQRRKYKYIVQPFLFLSWVHTN